MTWFDHAYLVCGTAFVTFWCLAGLLMFAAYRFKARLPRRMRERLG